MFIPTTPEELKKLGWESLDVILISGDAYIDSAYSGVALIGHQLIRAGYKTGIIAQPNMSKPDDLTRLGLPRLFWGVTAGMVDSMVANTTALGKPRRMDDNTPGGMNTKRPNRATIAYTNLIRRWIKNPAPIVLGGIEASLRRVAHYDFWSDGLRRPILLDAKADYLLYGMADHSIIELAETLKMRGDPRGIRGLCYLSPTVPKDYIELPSFEACELNKQKFVDMFNLFYQNNDPISAKGLAQKSGNRYVIQNPPAMPLTTEEMDFVYGADFENAVHPYYADMGHVRAMDTIRNSIITHRGCYGECNFCAIASHEGRHISWRSKESILKEAQKLTQSQTFRGIIHDLSGPTANMYGYDCSVKGKKGACGDRSCIYPEVCPSLKLTHQPHLELLREIRELPGVRRVFVGSGIRHDMVMADQAYGREYIHELTGHHVSGQLKLAPEHSQSEVLNKMHKPDTNALLAFKESFEMESEAHEFEQYLTYYIIAAHPGCTKEHMIELQNFASSSLGVLPEQVQIFTPTPSTYSSLMYYTEMDPFTGERIFVEKTETGKMQQKALITGWRGKQSREIGERSSRSSERSAPRKPRGDAPKRETRVVTDEEGRFFMNRKPEGWVDRKPKDRKPRRDDGDRPPFERRPYDPDRKPRRDDGDRPPRERRPYDPDRKPRRDDGDRPPFERRPYDPDRKPRRDDGDRPPFERRPYDPDRKPRRDDGDRPPFERRPYDPDRKPRRDDGDRPPFEHRPYDPDRKPRRDDGDRPPFERRPYDPDRKPRQDGDRPPRERRPYDPDRKPRQDGDRPPRERRPYDPDRKPRQDGDRPPRERRPYDPDRKPRQDGDRPPRERRPYDPDRKPRQDGDRPPRERRPYDPDRKPRQDGDRPPRERRPYDPDRKPRHEGNRPPRDTNRYGGERQRSHDERQRSQDTSRKPHSGGYSKDKNAKRD